MTDYLLGTKLSVILVFIIASMVFAFMSHSFHGYYPFCRDNVRLFGKCENFCSQIFSDRYGTKLIGTISS